MDVSGEIGLEPGEKGRASWLGMDSGGVGFVCLLNSVLSDATSGVEAVESKEGLETSVFLSSARAETEVFSVADGPDLGTIFSGLIEPKSFSWATNSNSRISIEL